MKAHLQDLLREALAKLSVDTLAGIELPADLPIERTRDAKNGDFASNIALQLAKPAQRKPRELAELIVAQLPASPQVAKVEIAGPGFINFFLSGAASQAVIGEILERKTAFGRSNSGLGRKVLVEFVSANPTGPMHVGHGRGAAYGDTVANLLGATGFKVTREYYINDAGRQADILALSAWIRYLELLGELSGENLPFPQRGYPAEYIKVAAEQLKTGQGERFRRAGAELTRDLPVEPIAAEDASEAQKATVKEQQEAHIDELIARAKALLGADYRQLQDSVLKDQLAAIRATLDTFGVRFDHWISERALVDAGKAEDAIRRLRKSGHVFEQDGAQWLKTTDFGDEKDRVLFKADGSATYFCNDIAYHIDKLDRGFELLVDVWGADHHGYIARVRAALEALTGRKDVLDVQLIQFVTLSSGRMGKRSGNFVTFNDLLGEAGKDATRFFYLLRGNDQHLEFDIELARSRTNENPVFYVQYAHARICSVEKQMREKGFAYDAVLALASLERLGETHEQVLITRLARYPEVVEQAALQDAPHALVHYLRDLADDFHSYYNAHQFLVEDAPLRNARLALVRA
ncbi:MAG: arginine--tRNA ligase, partial [Nevskiales bacterium]